MRRSVRALYATIGFLPSGRALLRPPAGCKWNHSPRVISNNVPLPKYRQRSRSESRDMIAGITDECMNEHQIQNGIRVSDNDMSLAGEAPEKMHGPA